MKVTVPIARAAFVAGLGLVFLTGCGSHPIPGIVSNERPVVELSAAPAPMDSVSYQVQLSWYGFDPDGRIDYYFYAVDPPALGDSAWVQIEATQVTLTFESSNPGYPLPDTGSVVSSDFHVFVIKAMDEEGLPSAPVHRAFTSYTVAPQSQILTPQPSRLQSAVTPPDVVVRWIGVDEDGTQGGRPTGYKLKLVTKSQIQQELGLGDLTPSPEDLQSYFEGDAPAFAGWNSVPGDTTFAELTELTTEQEYYFAVVAIDEAGAYEPRFLLDSNLLQFVPSLSRQAPIITIFNAVFNRTQLVGQASIDEKHFIKIEQPGDIPITFNWCAEPGVPGAVVTGYRWVLDPPGLDIFDETPRQDQNDTQRWSAWSPNLSSARVGPFHGEPGMDNTHHFIVQARDNYQDISMVVVEMSIIAATFEKPLLVIDDFRADPDEIPLDTPSGAFPNESILDSLLYARGGVPWQHQPLGRTTSDPGVFAGFDYDTLDYRFFPHEGLPLSVASKYSAIVWLVAAWDAGRRGGKFTSDDPMAALRFVNTAGELNTLGIYLQMGGDVWLFGTGVCPAIANGYVSRFGQPWARYPLDSGGDEPSIRNILWPGNFIYDFLHARSQIELNTRDICFGCKDLVDLIPYLPKHRTPGAAWPLVPGETPPRGPMDDPRVGPASERNLDPRASAGGWGIPAIPWDLPMLTVTTEWPDYPRRLRTSMDDVSYISLPNHILEDSDGNPATPMVSRLDTLYVGRAARQIISDRPTEPDGKPMVFYYWGEDHQGDVCWTSVDLWYFERTQLQVLAEIILNKFDLYKNPNPEHWPGPGSAHDTGPREISAR